MLLRLSRASFWLAAAVAALGLIAPAAYATPLLLVVMAASALAFGAWRAGLRASVQTGGTPGCTIPAAALDAAALREAGATLVREVDAADSFESALHAAARVLRLELGAREAAVHAVCGSDHRQVRLRSLVEARPGFRGVEHSVGVDRAPVGRAVTEQRPVGVPPESMALPVRCGGRVVAVLELSGFELAVEPVALACLLESVGTTLARRAAEGLGDGAGSVVSGRTNVLGIVDNRAATPIALGAAAREDRHSGDPEFDDCDSHPFRYDDAPRMLKFRPRVHAASADAGGAAAPAPARPDDGAADELDPTALARLAELDPGGANRLLERVLTAFQASVARLRPQADAARRGGDRPAIRLVAHTLKSSSASIGALGLSKLCADIEATIRADNSASLDADLDALDRALDAVLAAIARRLEPRA